MKAHSDDTVVHKLERGKTFFEMLHSPDLILSFFFYPTLDSHFF